MAEPLRQHGDDPSAALLAVVKAVASELRPRQAATLNVTLDSALDRDIGLDSLARVELLARVEKSFGVTLSEQAFAIAETPRDILQLLGAQGQSSALPLAAAPQAGMGAAAAPHAAETLVDVLNGHAETHPDRPHIRFYADEGEGDVITYGELKRGAERIAGGLLERNLQPGEAVILMLPTSPEYFFSFFGVMLAGGIPVPTYPPARPNQVEEHLRRHVGIANNCRAAVMITIPEAKRFGQLLKLQAEGLRDVVTAEELMASAVRSPGRRPGPQDIAFLQYTSGSTGAPKGVVLTHANLLANVRAMGAALQVTADDVFVSWLPLYHDMGLIGAWFGNLYHASLLVIMSPLSFLARPERWLRAIHRYRATLSGGPNFAYDLCLRRIDERTIEELDLSSWRVAINGAEPVSPETVDGFIQRFKVRGFRPETMMPCFGLAECSVGLAFPPQGRPPLIDRIQRGKFMRSGVATPADPADAGALRIVACGQPLPGHQIRVVDAVGRELPDRQEGRLQFRGPSATSGYYRNPEATRALFDGRWLNSGDLAYIVAGDVFITGRTKDLIIRAGRNISPAELEEAIGELPGVQKGNVAVFGSHDPVQGTERLVVLAETRASKQRPPEQLRSDINGIVTDLIGAPPDDIVLAPPRSVLKTSSGKIRRAACRELYEAGRIGQPGLSVRWQVARLVLAGIVPALRRRARVAMATLYGIHATFVFLSIGLAAWLAVAVVPPMSWRWSITRTALRLIAAFTGTRLRVRGRENLPPPERSCLYVSNHASYLDGPVLIPVLGREFSFVAKVELTENFVSRIYLSRIGAEFIERFDRQKSTEVAKRIAAGARAGRSYLFFAEGTFDRMPGLLPFQMGAFLAAAEAEVPVVPIAIRGTRSKLRSESALPRAGAIEVVIGTPIDAKAVKERMGGDAWMTAVQLRDETRRQILNATGEPDLEHERLLLERRPPG